MSNDTALSLPESILGDERGNINVTSNSIVTLERKEDRYAPFQPDGNLSLILHSHSVEKSSEKFHYHIF